MTGSAAVIPVAVHGFSINTGLLTALVALMSAILGALVKLWPQLRQMGNARRKDDMDGFRADIATIKEDAKEARDEARRVSGIAQRLENMVACMRPAISILCAEIKRLDPDNPNNPALMQAQDLMAMAAAGDLGFANSMVGLATVKGAGE